MRTVRGSFRRVRLSYLPVSGRLPTATYIHRLRCGQSSTLSVSYFRQYMRRVPEIVSDPVKDIVTTNKIIQNRSLLIITRQDNHLYLHSQARSVCSNTAVAHHLRKPHKITYSRYPLQSIRQMHLNCRVSHAHRTVLGHLTDGAHRMARREIRQSTRIHDSQVRNTVYLGASIDDGVRIRRIAHCT